MAARRPTVELSETDFAALEQLAVAERRSIEEIVGSAVRDYLARKSLDLAEWQRRWDDVINRIQSRIPPEITPEEIEADIQAAVREVREGRRARRD